MVLTYSLSFYYLCKDTIFFMKIFLKIKKLNNFIIFITYLFLNSYYFF